jgi:hypothetical protein
MTPRPHSGHPRCQTRTRATAPSLHAGNPASLIASAPLTCVVLAHLRVAPHTMARRCSFMIDWYSRPAEGQPVKCSVRPVSPGLGRRGWMKADGCAVGPSSVAARAPGAAPGAPLASRAFAGKREGCCCCGGGGGGGGGGALGDITLTENCSRAAWGGGGTRCSPSPPPLPGRAAVEPCVARCVGHTAPPGDDSNGGVGPGDTGGAAGCGLRPLAQPSELAKSSASMAMSAFADCSAERPLPWLLPSLAAVPEPASAGLSSPALGGRGPGRSLPKPLSLPAGPKAPPKLEWLGYMAPGGGCRPELVACEPSGTLGSTGGGTPLDEVWWTMLRKDGS